MQLRYACDQRPRILEILRADRRGRPESERADRTGRIVAGILREGGRALDEQIRHVPALQISVERAVPWIVAHDGAAAEMRGLILGDVVGPLRGCLTTCSAPIFLMISA